MPTAKLIGGPHHRSSFLILGGQKVIRIARPVQIFPLKREDFMHAEEIKFDEYIHANSLFDWNDIFPDYVFLPKDINPLEFVKNVITDYCR